jgi:rhodanese-related sulfurtransferase
MSSRAASLVAKRGYKNIMIFREGIKGWERAGYFIEEKYALPAFETPKITAQKLKEILARVNILDIRPKHLYKRGQIQNSLKITMEELADNYPEIPKDKLIVIVDHNEKQSHIAGRFLHNKGFKKIVLLEGGLMRLILKGESF